MKKIEKLNSQQRKAVAHKDGPCLIIAGAGTGKTKVITHRIAHIIKNKWAKPSEILALTFTDKASEEMEKRVDLLVPYGFVDTWISTFHAFGDRILRDFAIDIGLPANFKILTSTEQAIFMRQNLYAFDLKYYRPISNPIAHINELLNHFSRLKDELISPSEYLKFAEGCKLKAEGSVEDKVETEKTLELANAYGRYQDLMLQAGNLDYGDQIFLTYKLLVENPAVLKACRNKFKYILVDEFQDTNFAQYQIVKLLSKGHQNITVVGDDDQSIYRFRGASVSNILSFKKDFPKCTQIVLNQNYRSTKQILDASYKLIQHNNPDRLEVQNKIDKKLISKTVGDAPALLHCDTLSCESDTVAAKIEELVKKKKFKFSDFAILSRANNHLEPFIQSLNQRNIPNIFVGASSLFKRPEIKMLVAFFRCLALSDNNLSFHQLSTSELYEISENVLSKYYTLARRQNKSFEDLYDLGLISDSKTEEVICDIRKYRNLIGKKTAGEILFEFLKEKNYFKDKMAAADIDSELKIANIAKFFDRILQFDHSSDDKSVLAFLENLELILQVGDEVQSSDIDPDLDAVNLMTAHASKGLEWPVVFIVNAVTDRFPSKDRREKIPIPDELIKERLPQGDFHLQEERRLFYVASTRAKNFLFISSADDYGGKRTKKLSQFVLEIFDDPSLIKEKKKLSPMEKIERFGTNQNEENSKLKIHNSKFSEAPLSLSRQQIDDYFTCPKKYYFSSIIKIPLPLNWHFMYGTAIHEAVGRYFQKKIAGQKPDLNSVIADFEQSFVSEGFITREHEEERKRKGIETLTKFYDEDQIANILPDKVEERFDFREDGVRVNGRYDLILNDGKDVTICDFKTSEVRDQKDADRRVRESNQMKIYALAWAEKYHVIPETSLIFIESNIKAQKVFSQDELSKTKEMILESAQGISKGDFTAKPSKRQCELCPYKDICPDSLA